MRLYLYQHSNIQTRKRKLQYLAKPNLWLCKWIQQDILDKQQTKCYQCLNYRYRFHKDVGTLSLKDNNNLHYTSIY